jgi:hypothetical protein
LTRWYAALPAPADGAAESKRHSDCCSVPARISYQAVLSNAGSKNKLRVLDGICRQDRDTSWPAPIYAFLKRRDLRSRADVEQRLSKRAKYSTHACSPKSGRYQTTWHFTRCKETWYGIRMFGSLLKIAFWPHLGVGSSFLVLEIRTYSCG